MPVTLTPITLPQLTEATTNGSGVFDVLMKATKAHLEQEFTQGRIKGAEYATVYLGSLEAVMSNALQFLLQKDKTILEGELLNKQIALAEVELAKANAELLIIQQGLPKIQAEIANLQAQTALTQQQKENIAAEALNIPKQGILLDAQALQVQKQTEIASQEVLIKQQQVLTAQAEVEVARAKLVNIPKEGALLDAQAAVQNQQSRNLASEKLGIEARTLLTTQQTANAVLEGKVLTAQECKLRAEYDVLLSTNLKTREETALLLWKTNTEKAQTMALGVDDNSVIGKQKALYGAQTDGFKRDAEQKAAKLLADTWSVRRTTDEATVADATNKLNDATVGRAIEKLLSGIGA